MTTLQFAQDLPLAGTVRNTPDGAVELIVQGETAPINALVTHLHEHFGSFIRTMTYSTSPPIGQPARGLRIVD